MRWNCPTHHGKETLCISLWIVWFLVPLPPPIYSQALQWPTANGFLCHNITAETLPHEPFLLKWRQVVVRQGKISSWGLWATSKIQYRKAFLTPWNKHMPESEPNIATKGTCCVYVKTWRGAFNAAVKPNTKQTSTLSWLVNRKGSTT